MSRFNPAHALVVLQASLSSVFLVGAGLLTHTFFGSRAPGPGIQSGYAPELNKRCAAGIETNQRLLEGLP
jgi:hypothetical protein